MAVRAAGRVPPGPAHMSRLAGLKLLVNQRLNAAVEEIFGHFERAIVEYEEEMERRHRRLLEELLTPGIKLPHAVSPADVQQLQQGGSSSLDQEGPDPPPVKEEQEEPWTRLEGEQLGGLEEAGVTKFTFTCVPVKTEDDEEKPRPAQLHHSQAEEHRGAEPLSCSSAHHMKAEADGDAGVGGPEPAGSLDPGALFHPGPEDRMTDSDPETDDNDFDWLRPGDARSGSCSVDGVEVGARAEAPRSGGASVASVASVACSECGETFLSQPSLTLHRRTHAAAAAYSCAVCHAVFGARQAWLQHARTHAAPKPFACAVCGKTFSQKSYLRKHTRVHSGQKLFGCSLCSKRFRQHPDLVAHFRVHTGEKPFSCAVCKKTFRYSGHVSRHMRTHTGKKPLGCAVCGLSFKLKIHLAEHMLTHSGLR